MISDRGSYDRALQNADAEGGLVRLRGMTWGRDFCRGPGVNNGRSGFRFETSYESLHIWNEAADSVRVIW